jgi:hypothetical protein
VLEVAQCKVRPISWLNDARGIAQHMLKVNNRVISVKIAKAENYILIITVM